MTNAKLRLHNTQGLLSLAVVGSAALAFAGACKDDDTDQPIVIYAETGPDEGETAGTDSGTGTDGEGIIEVSEDIVEACESYCSKAAECNEETEKATCEKECQGVLYACEEHQPGEALDQVKDCGEKDCLALVGCTASAGIQCLTGLGF